MSTPGEATKRLGIIAGNGRFPLLVAEEARKQGWWVVAVAHQGETLPELEPLVDELEWIRVGQIGRMINRFQSSGVRDVVMAGGIKKTRLFTEARPDLRALALLAKLRTKDDDAILRGLADELERSGLVVGDSMQYLTSLLAAAGPMGARRPTAEEQKDIEYGREMAKEIGRLGIGQCVVVKQHVVLAVEAIEGTDEAIRRGGRLANGGAVVVKVSKPGQDRRFDLPTIGPGTIAVMAEAGAAVIAVEAGGSLLLDRAALLRDADRANIAVVGVAP
ncbi:MAG: UDP-2,3-diacylglucosamine diphosphatase LpxI [Nitrospirota bacterium]